MICCIYSLVLINRLNNCKILIAHMDAVLNLPPHIYSIALSTLQNYVATLYCEQLWHLPIILAKCTGTDITL